jgi:hypothetical protein
MKDEVCDCVAEDLLKQSLSSMNFASEKKSLK